LAVGGEALEPFAFAGLPSIQRLHPLLPDTRRRYGCNFSSMHNPIVEARGVEPGSICHHLQV